MLHQYDSRCFNSEPKLLKIWLTDKNGSKDEKQIFKPNINYNPNTNLKIISNNNNNRNSNSKNN